MSEKRIILPTTRVEKNSGVSYERCKEYDETLNNLATACYDLSKGKSLIGPFFTFKVKPKEDSYKLYMKMMKTRNYECNTCHHFINTYGNAVYINEDGKLESVFWNPDAAVGFMVPVVKALKDNVENGDVEDIIYINPNTRADVIHKDKNIIEFGSKIKGNYNHFYGEIYDKEYVYDKNINLKNVFRDLLDLFIKFSTENIQTAFAISDSPSNTLYGMKFKLLKDIFEDVNGTNNEKYRYNKMRRYACIYHEVLYGFANTVDGEFIQDIRDGYDPEECINRYNYKKDPLRYKRPTAAPSKHLVNEAEKIITEMGLEDSLKRRIAKLSDIPEDKIIWKKSELVKEDNKKSTGIFSCVITKEDLNIKDKDPVLDLTRKNQKITYAKFKRDVLPKAESIQMYLPSYRNGFTKLSLHYPFAQYVTEAIPGSKQILKYKNPFVIYMYNGGSTKKEFNLNDESLVEVEAVILHPEVMDEENTNDINKGAVFVIKDCKDTLMKGGLALFPDSLIDELYPVRKVIESFSNNGKLEDIEPNEQSAAGIMVMDEYPIVLKVKTSNNTLEMYTIDRLE